MANIVKEVRLIYTDIVTNNNKWWTGELYDNGDVKTRWGRVAMGEQSKLFPGKGEPFLLKKQKEKLGKGYSELRTVTTSGAPTIQKVSQGDLLDIASKQIKTSSPTLNAVIKNLVSWNIHQITSSTNVTYNASSGLFETPLGIVTLDGITEARNILSDAASLLANNDYGSKMVMDINQYLRIVPQNIGMKKLEPQIFFPDLQAIQKQNDILDSLEASYKALQTPVQSDNDKEEILEQVFKVRLDAVSTESPEFKHIQQKYQATRKDIHVCSHLKVKNIFKVEIEDNVKAFETGNKVGNVMELWHGTKKANVLSILKSGLQVSPPSTARIAGKMFGNGIYFAIDSTKSLNYSYGYWDGQRESNCFMFLASVALGNPYTPRGTYESLPKSGFDSTWAKPGKSGIMNDEIIVYENDRFKLEYLVEFE